MPSLPPPPPGLDVMETKTGQLISSVVAMAVLAFIAVVLRVWSRLLSKAPFKLDDWLIILALVCFFLRHVSVLLLTDFNIGFVVYPYWSQRGV